MVRLFATDLDGTLIDTNKNITKKNIDAIKKVKDKGITTAICTGRTMSEIRHIEQFEEVSRYIDYIIYENGASCIDNNSKEMIFKHTLKHEDIEKVHSKLSDFDMMFEIYSEGNAHCNADLLHTQGYKKYVNEDFHTLVQDTRIGVDNVIEYAKDKSTQMILISFLTHENSVMAYEIIRLMDNYITFAGRKGLEVHDNEVDKGKGLIALSNKLNIHKSNVIAIGDSYNDLPMRAATDRLIAMDNATSKLKNISDYVTKSNNDSGVAYAIEQFCL